MTRILLCSPSTKASVCPRTHRAQSAKAPTQAVPVAHGAALAAGPVAQPIISAMTTPAQLERLGEHLRKLRLLKSGERLEALLQEAAARELPYAEFLDQVLGEEVAAKTSKNIAMRTAMARFPLGVDPL